MTQSTLPTRRALHAYPGPVGELVSREISAHMDALVRTGDTLVPGLVTQLLGLSPPDSHRCQSRGGRGDSFAHPTDADYTGLAEVAWGPRRQVLLVLSRTRPFVRSGNGPTRDHHEQRRRVID